MIEIRTNPRIQDKGNSGSITFQDIRLREFAGEAVEVIAYVLTPGEKVIRQSRNYDEKTMSLTWGAV